MVPKVFFWDWFYPSCFSSNKDWIPEFNFVCLYDISPMFSGPTILWKPQKKGFLLGKVWIKIHQPSESIVASSTTANALRSRGSTGRSKGMPMGNPQSPSARMGNLLTARTMILMLVAAALNVWVILEQPSTSLMEYHVLFQRFLRLVPMRVLTMQMADYGSPTAKPTLLYSSILYSSETVFFKRCFFLKLQSYTSKNFSSKPIQEDCIV